ncbi:ATP-binding protein [Paramicrobacterium agarici]|uniref:histidine kinase n=1 Tax=Paramicrobacterium agarici TaxID=630514 RepID=A0A2A9DRR8_9MICO|nr:sensor histidine kinase [Microbacterium agarici]PFG29368.1 two-component system CitB family sensor kinase [Microbacterium agarici]TQO22376.1 two-component system CitB family sensor kinase [Microbacterium agarici]
MTRPMSLRVQLLVLQVSIVLVTVVTAGVASSWFQERELREAYKNRMVSVAESIASMPAILDAYETENPAETIQPIAEVIRQASNVTYVVVTDADGIRYSHPTESRIGKRVSTDPSIPLSGEMYVGTQTGTLGESWRVKVPVFDGDEVIGTVSVGMLESMLDEALVADTLQLVIVLAIAAGLGVLGSAWATRVIRRRIYSLEPDEIAALLETRDAMLHGIREGIVAVDDKQRIVLINDEARRLLDLDGEHYVGRAASDVLEPAVFDLVDEGDVDERLILAGHRVLIAHSDRVSVPSGPTASVLILRDHTHLHEMLRELEGVQSLAEGLRAQAHEFSNQLHVISGLIELGHADEAVAIIERTNGGGTLNGDGAHPGIVDLEVSALLISLDARARERAIALAIDPQSSLRDLSSDLETRIDVLTVVANLIENALDACELGGTVAVSIRDDHGYVVVVRDDGPGIPDDLAQHVFDAGVSTKTSANGRRGIGLALVRRIARRRRGDVTVVSEPGSGSTFTAVLADVHARPTERAL